MKRNVGNVVKVTDGDTLKIRIKGIGIRDVRLLGVDTPEKYGKRECGAVLATQSMEELAPVGSTVVLLSDPSQADKDRYGRLLRYVERKGRDVGRAQIFTGHSKVYVFNNDPVRRTGNYRTAEKQAKNRGAGLWSTCWT
ncbi:thermonuclease family protein [Nocardioides sp. SOB77]|uniref:Thermonuclease family protein n=1 Tax=Nocardioides oceani TaxID=3058369 RepID=A0ABT8FLT3_9ACTN|nr:thermonuclease family protein [Nocardioides oceani]MDN4175633.1 thermonuclease family protein [Nocardioides oceani]